MRAALPVALLALGACSSPGSGLERCNAAGRSDTLPFSHGVLAGGFYFVAGTLGIDQATGKPPADPEQEVRAMLDDFRTKLALVELTMDDLVSVTVFCFSNEARIVPAEEDVVLTPALYDTFNRVYATYFEEGFPARAFIGSGPLLRGCRFEIQGIAALR